jgi:hypothetical protein
METVPKFYRVIAPSAALVAFFALTALYVLGDHPAYAAILRFWGIAPGAFGPFLDMHGLTAAWRCHHLGLDVVARDPCDVMDRSFNYSPLWLSLAPFHLADRAGTPLGWGTGLLFLLSLFLLPPPARKREVLTRLLASLSTMVVFAVERGNPDIMIFMLAMLAGFLALRSPRARLAAYAIGLFAGLLKYYPLTLMALALRERPARLVAIGVAALAAALLFAAAHLSDLERGLPLIAHGPYFTDLFAAKNLPFGLAQTFGIAVGDKVVPLGWSLRVFAYAVYAALLLAAAWSCRRLMQRSDLSAALAALTPAEAIFLVIGCLLIGGCFFAGQNIGYRGIYLLFVLPGLLALSRHARERRLRILADGTAALAVALMWGECFRTNLLAGLGFLEIGPSLVDTVWLNFWLLRELAWWWLIAVMLAVLADFALRSQLAQRLAALYGRRGGAIALR